MSLKYSILILRYLINCFPGFIENSKLINNNQLLLDLKSKKDLFVFMYFLNKNTLLNYKILVDMCGVHYLQTKVKYEIVYNLLNIKTNHRLFIKVKLDQDYDSIMSMTKLYDSANWLEREVFDMFGLKFINHPDLRRILTDYGFRGHPLKKNFPLSGYIEVRYDDSKKHLVYEPVEFAQNFRNFDIFNPWTIY